jgi:hypothetical protein
MAGGMPPRGRIGRLPLSLRPVVASDDTVHRPFDDTVHRPFDGATPGGGVASPRDGGDRREGAGGRRSSPPDRPPAGTGPTDRRSDVRTTGGPRHCWVVGYQLAPGRWPGLLLQWRRTEHGWSGLVAFVVTGTDDDPVFLQLWLPAEQLRPAPDH